MENRIRKFVTCGELKTWFGKVGQALLFLKVNCINAIEGQKREFDKEIWNYRLKQTTTNYECTQSLAERVTNDLKFYPVDFKEDF